MRWCSVLCLPVGLVLAARAQEPPIVLQSRPDVLIRVRPSNVGAYYVNVQMVAEDYPPRLLEKQCTALGEYIGNPVRGLSITYTSTGTKPDGKLGRILSAEFAADYLVDQKTGVPHLLPFAQAFAGAPKPYEIRVIGVAFTGLKPKAGVTIQSFKGETADLDAHFDPAVPLLEYRITLKTQDPAAISFPKTAQEKPKPPPAPSKKGFPAALLGWVAAAALVVGVLVYFALRPYRKVQPGSISRKSR